MADASTLRRPRQPKPTTPAIIFTSPPRQSLSFSSLRLTQQLKAGTILWEARKGDGR
jgi:hypothetical protein